MKSLSDSVLKQQFPTAPLKFCISLIRHYPGFAKKRKPMKTSFLLFFLITSFIYTNQDFPDTMKPKQIAKNQLDVEATKKAGVTQKPIKFNFCLYKILVFTDSLIREGL